VKKSTEASWVAWLFRNVRHVCDGGFGCRIMYLETEALEILMPSLRSSLWILGVPQPTLSRLRVRISSRVSFATHGRPGCPWRTFQVQYQRKPRRCQSITVAGLRSTAPIAIGTTIETDQPKTVDRRASAWAWDFDVAARRSDAEAPGSPVDCRPVFEGMRGRTKRMKATCETWPQKPMPEDD